MTTDIRQRQREAVRMGSVAATKPNFVPPSDFPELEEARRRHEETLEEHAGIAKRRADAAKEEAQLREHLDAVQASKRAANKEAQDAVKNATIKALEVVAEHGEEWLAKIAAEREEALAERDELLAKAAEAEARANKDNALAAWLEQTASSPVPAPFSAGPSRPFPTAVAS